MPSDLVNPTQPVLQPEPSILAFAPIFLYFVVAGIATVMLGPLLPALIPQWHIQDAQAGSLFAASFAGQFTGAWISSCNLRGSIIYGAAISAIGCCIMAFTGYPLAHIALFALGIGIGAGLTAGNILVGTAFTASRARLLANLNVAWGIGAISCPLLVQAVGKDNTRTFFLITASILALTGFYAITLPFTTQPSRPTDLSAQQANRQSLLPLPLPQLILFGIAIFLYVGIENTLNGWLPTYAGRINPTAHTSTIALTFWVAELVGRVLVAAIMSIYTEAFLFRLCLGLLILSQAALCIAAYLSIGSMIALTALAAFTLAPLYPILLAFVLAHSGNHPRLGPFFALAALGGGLLPSLTGLISTQRHNLRAGLIVPAAGCVLLLILSPRITQHPSAPPTPNQ